MKGKNIAIYRLRRMIAAILAVAAVVGIIIANPASREEIPLEEDAVAEGTTDPSPTPAEPASGPLATTVLDQLEIKGRAPKTGYTREEFYKTWPNVDGCSLRQRIIRREVGESAVLADDQCTVVSGSFIEPYTGKILEFHEKSDFSTGIQIDHVVALSDAWQKGAQQLSADERYQLATDPLNLLAVDSSANQQKSDGDAATWLPSNKSFRCQYVARQVSVKFKYHLWLTQAEYDAIFRILETCPTEPAVGVTLDTTE